MPTNPPEPTDDGKEVRLSLFCENGGHSHCWQTQHRPTHLWFASDLTRQDRLGISPQVGGWAGSN
jgi:hypothetical protein